MGPIFFYLFVHSLLVNTQADDDVALWSKHYITYSVENEFNNTNDIINAVNEWNIEPILEFKHVPQGQGDIQFYVVNDLPNNVSGRATYPEVGKIKINRLIYAIGLNATKIYQHEFGHALGMHHSDNNQSILYFSTSVETYLLESDKELLKEFYRCRYDSVTLLNDQTYFAFRGRYYTRIDLNTEDITNDTLWHPNITTVTTMYRNNSRYFIIQDKTYYQFDIFMTFEKTGHVQEIFPPIKRKVTSVLNFNNGTFIYFLKDNHIWHNNVEYRQKYNTRNSRTFSRYPLDDVQGSYVKANKIYLVSKNYLYHYDKNFNFIRKTQLCYSPKVSKIHCCNNYSDMGCLERPTDDSKFIGEFN